MSDLISRREFIAFGAGVLTTIGGLVGLNQWATRDLPVLREDGSKVQLFLHIPKTGGTSLREHIMRSVKAHQIVMPERPENIWHLTNNYSQYLNAHDYIYVRGHFALDWRRFLGSYQDKTECITMLRNPVSRFRSAYQYQSTHWATKGSYIETVLQRTPETLSNAVDIFNYDASQAGFKHDHFLFEFNNGMTRRLSGEGWNIPYRQTNKAMLEAAKANLKNRFKIIGVTEEYNKFLYLLKNEYGWDLKPSIRKNTTKKKMAITDQDREKILELNALDQELHAYARDLSHELFDKLSDDKKNAYQDFIKI